MRARTAFNRILAIPGIRVLDVEISGEEIRLRVALSARAARCGSCGSPGPVYDHRPNRTWRHLDILGRRTYLVMDLRRVSCSDCGVRTEAVPFADAAARHSRALCRAVIWSAMHMDKSAVARLWGLAWETVDAIVARAVGSVSPPSSLRAIGVDERSWRRRRALTVVVDHDTAKVIWAGEGTTASVLKKFLASLDPATKAGIRLVSMDMGRAYQAAVRAELPNAVICFDPFHVVQAANVALDALRRALGRQMQLSGSQRSRLRFALLASRRRLSESETEMLEGLADSRAELHRVWMAKEGLADLYRVVAPEAARDYLSGWLAGARSSGIPALESLAATVADHFDGIVAAREAGLSNSRLEGYNAKIALINRRGYGHRNLAALLNLVYLCCGTVPRPEGPYLPTSGV